MDAERAQALGAAEQLAAGLSAALSFASSGPALKAFAFEEEAVSCAAEGLATIAEIEQSFLLKTERGGLDPDQAGADALGQLAGACRKFAADWAA